MSLTAISTGQLTDSDSTAVEASGVVHVTMTGTWGGATAKLQMTPDDGTTYVDIPGASGTANTTFIVDLGLGCKIRVNTAGGAGAAITTRIGAIP